MPIEVDVQIFKPSYSKNQIMTNKRGPGVSTMNEECIDKKLCLMLFREYGRSFIPHFKLKIGLPCDSFGKLQYSESIAAQIKRKVQHEKNIIVTPDYYIWKVNLFYCHLQFCFLEFINFMKFRKNIVNTNWLRYA